MANSNTPEKVQREARLRWVPIAKMKVSPVAQRDLNQARVDRMAADFDLEQIGTPVVNDRDGSFYVIDGQHRIEALKAIGWGDQQIQCETYLNLSDDEMAEVFLKRNDALAVSAFDKFRVGVVADREVETDINRIVQAQGLCVSRDQIPGSIRAVGTLRKLYARAGGPTLGRTLRIIRDAYGDAGLEAPVIDGLGLVAQRYNGQLNDQQLVKKLADAHGGVSGLLNKAEQTRRATGNQKAQCVAAAAVETYNRGARGKGRLPDWWKADS